MGFSLHIGPDHVQEVNCNLQLVVDLKRIVGKNLGWFVNSWPRYLSNPYILQFTFGLQLMIWPWCCVKSHRKLFIEPFPFNMPHLGPELHREQYPQGTHFLGEGIKEISIDPQKSEQPLKKHVTYSTQINHSKHLPILKVFCGPII